MNFEKRPGLILFQKGMPSLGEILVSPLLAHQTREKWGTRFLGVGEIGWDGVLGREVPRLRSGGQIVVG